jgi:CRP-like cAMP-binding protein
VVVRLRQQVVLPGDDVFSAGDAGGELFFIGRGRVEVTDGGQGRVLATLDAGEFFGEVEAFGTRTRRLATATARTFCDLFVIGKEELAEVLAEFPEYQHAIRAAAEQRIAELAARGAVLDEHPARRAPLDARAAVAEETAPAADDGAAAAAVPSPVSTLGDAERLVDELMRWQSAQATAMHRQLALLEEAQAGVALKLQALTQAHAHATAKQQRAASGGGAVPQALNALRSGAAALSRRLRVVHPRDPAPVQPSGGRV